MGLELKLEDLAIEAGGKAIVFLHEEDAAELGLHPLDRVIVSNGRASATAIVDITKKMVREGQIGASNELLSLLHVRPGKRLKVESAPEPESLKYIRHKLEGRQLSQQNIYSIVRDVVARNLSDIEIASFLTALELKGTSMEEVESLSRAMVATGKTLDLGVKGPILDKHNVGGIPGDKTTMLLVPIIAAAGYHIPKTSSRAITSPAGTADKVEVLAPVDLSLEEIRRVVKKTRGCMVWGGAVDLAPADDLFIQVEYPLAIDPMLLPSIISKKKCAGATHVVIDIPYGLNTKFTTLSEARYTAHNFLELGKRMGMEVRCAITNGEQPLGRAIGPALEVREVLQTLKGNAPVDQIEKALHLAGILLETVGVANGRSKAYEIWKSGKAEAKFRQIIGEQGGDAKIKPGEIKVGGAVSVESAKAGMVYRIDNKKIAAIARAAGAPKDKGAGIMLHKKIGEQAKKGEVLFEVFAEKNHKRETALKLAHELMPYSIVGSFEHEVLVEKIGRVDKRMLLLER